MNRAQLRKQVKAGIVYTGSQVAEMLELERSGISCSSAKRERLTF